MLDMKYGAGSLQNVKMAALEQTAAGFLIRRHPGHAVAIAVLNPVNLDGTGCVTNTRPPAGLENPQVAPSKHVPTPNQGFGERAEQETSLMNDLR